MRRISLILTVPLAVIVVVFALTNRAATEIRLWPFGIELAPPLFFVVLGCALVGFFIGAMIMWLSNGRLRRRLGTPSGASPIWSAICRMADAARRKAAKAVTPVGDSRIPSTELTQGPQRPAA